MSNFLKNTFFIFRERGERERNIDVREKHQLVVSDKLPDCALTRIEPAT